MSDTNSHNSIFSINHSNFNTVDAIENVPIFTQETGLLRIGQKQLPNEVSNKSALTFLAL